MNNNNMNHILAANEARFSNWMSSSDCFHVERVKNLYHFNCKDGSNGTFNIETGTFYWHKDNRCIDTPEIEYN